MEEDMKKKIGGSTPWRGRPLLPILGPSDFLLPGSYTDNNMKEKLAAAHGGAVALLLCTRQLGNAALCPAARFVLCALIFVEVNACTQMIVLPKRKKRNDG